MYKGCFVCKKGGRLEYTFGAGRYQTVCAEIDMVPEIINGENVASHKANLAGVEFIFCTWDMVPFSKEQIAEFFPNLRVVFYAAGSVQYFARPFMELGVRVVSAWRAMSVPVAEFTVAAITFANKASLSLVSAYKSKGYHAAKQLLTDVYPGTYDTTVGILGAGAIGSLVVRMLAPYRAKLMVYDPFLTKERMNALGIDRTYSLEEVFSSCQTISNHLANNEQTVGMLDYALFSKMGETAAFINTGRGAQVVEADLVRALTEQPLRSAYLDVTHPEPLESSHPFLSMPNVFVFPHIAGTAKNEVLMLSDCVIDQYRRYRDGLPFECEVTLDMLATMA